MQYLYGDCIVPNLLIFRLMIGSIASRGCFSAAGHYQDHNIFVGMTDAGMVDDKGTTDLARNKVGR